MGNIYHLFSDLLNKQNEFDEKVGKWLSYLERVEKVKSHRKQFHQWSPLRIYISLGEIKENPKFSLRFLGQEVGNIVVKEKIPRLSIEKHHHIHNLKYFAEYFPETADKFCLEKGEYKWRSGEVKKFRRDFKEIPKGADLKIGIPEHRIEAAFIKEMESKKKNKFDGRVGLIQPVKVANCPLQIPLPFSASKGDPKFKSGHIDILARRGHGKNVKLSVWELKSPKTLSSAVEQVYIYVLTLLHILRSKHGEEWYKLCGFKNNIPSELNIEAVVAVTKDQEEACREQYNGLIKENPLKIENDQISFSLALYDGASLKIKSFQPL